MLRDEDCDNGQGFLLSRPLDVAGTEAFFKETAKHAARSLAAIGVGCYLALPCGWMVSPRASIATKRSMRRARVSLRLAS